LEEQLQASQQKCTSLFKNGSLQDIRVTLEKSVYTYHTLNFGFRFKNIFTKNAPTEQPALA
jgi:hypothetical protein